MNKRGLLRGTLGLLVAGLTGAPALAQNLWETLPFPTSYPTPDTEGASQVNGISLYHAEWGAGSPVILLHGGLGSIEAWANQIPALAAKYHVIAIDSRGHGRSTRDEQPYSYDLMAADVLALMDQMGIGKAAFAGWSDGGIIALDIAVNNPDRIDRAVVIGTNYTVDGVDPAVETNATFGAYVGAAAELYAKNSPTPDQFDTFVGEISGMWGSQPNFTEAELGAITARFTVLQAAHDEAILRAHAEKMASLIPGAKYVLVDGVSHFAMWQDPDRLTGHMLDALDGW